MLNLKKGPDNLQPFHFEHYIGINQLHEGGGYLILLHSTILRMTKLHLLNIKYRYRYSTVTYQ
jgi:hypothetical protein